MNIFFNPWGAGKESWTSGHSFLKHCQNRESFTRCKLVYIRAYMTECLSHRFSKCMRTLLKLLSRCPRPGTLTSLATKQMIKHHDTALRPTRLHGNNLQTRNLQLVRFVGVAAPPTHPFQYFGLKLVPSQLKTYITGYFDTHGNASFSHGKEVVIARRVRSDRYVRHSSLLQLCNVATLIHSFLAPQHV